MDSGDGSIVCVIARRTRQLRQVQQCLALLQRWRIDPSQSYTPANLTRENVFIYKNCEGPGASAEAFVRISPSVDCLE